jgi:hypothetical protein
MSHAHVNAKHLMLSALAALMLLVGALLVTAPSALAGYGS